MGTAGELLGSSGFVRPRRGVVDECCRRVCTLPTLMSYCAAGHVVSTGTSEERRLVTDLNDELVLFLRIWNIENAF